MCKVTLLSSRLTTVKPFFILASEAAVFDKFTVYGGPLNTACKDFSQNFTDLVTGVQADLVTNGDRAHRETHRHGGLVENP